MGSFTVTLTLLAALAGVPSHAAGPALVTTVAYTFVPGNPELGPSLTVEQGSDLLYANADIDFHTVTADELRPGGEPLFDTGTPIGAGSVAEVAGVNELGPGRYRFHCSVHFGMAGVLEVVPRS